VRAGTRDAGIGKSTLAACLIEAALGDGMAVAYGSPHDSTGSRAFRPWLQALDRWRGHTHGHHRQARLRVHLRGHGECRLCHCCRCVFGLLLHLHEGLREEMGALSQPKLRRHVTPRRRLN
jgi:hypothetical protein